MAIANIKKIAWVTSTLNEPGGGTRLLLEGVKYYRSLGIDVLVITWDFNEDALFNGRYSKDGIVEIKGSRNTGNSLTSRATKRLASIKTLRTTLKEFNPDVIFNQSEYDATLLRLALVGTKYPHVSFVFGQMFQFPKDLAKYAFPFNRHLDEIRTSTAGYREFVTAKRPPSRFRDIALAQAIALPRYFALRASEKIFVFSKQVQWEVSKIYGANAHILKGAFPREILDRSFNYNLSRIKKHADERILLSVCRLIQKKRVALKIRALAVLVHERRIKNLRLVIAGKGEETERLNQLVDQLNLRDHVTFLGYVPDDEVYPLTSVCDVFLSLDVADFDISPFEALALKRKVIWSSEMDLDTYLENCPAVFPVDPVPQAVADAVERALALDTANVDWSGRATYAWESYFDAILDRIQRRG